MRGFFEVPQKWYLYFIILDLKNQHEFYHLRKPENGK